MRRPLPTAFPFGCCDPATGHRRRFMLPPSSAVALWCTILTYLARSTVERRPLATGTTDERDEHLFLARMERDAIQHLWVIYTDYNGRSQAKSVPRGRFQEVTTRGVTFARANLDF